MAYQPASTLTTSGGLSHLASVYYERRALDNIKQFLVFMGITESDDIPKRNGTTVQFYRYGVFGSNVTPTSEGVVSTGITPSTSTISATVSEYSDFITISSLLEETAIDSVVENTADELGYRAALTVDTLIRTELESNTGNDQTPLSGGSTGVADLRSMVSQLKAVNVRPREGSDFVGVFHPYITHDIKADNTSGGFIDIAKYAEPNRLLNHEVGKVEGVRIMESTNVGTSGSAPSVNYAGYVVGKGAIGAVSLAGSGPSKPPKDPTTQRAFRVNVIPGKPQIADPEGKIGAAMSYRFVFVSVLLDESTLRYRTLNADATLV
jgi:N4-gp56 family major capsid protein